MKTVANLTQRIQALLRELNFGDRRSACATEEERLKLIPEAVRIADEIQRTKEDIKRQRCDWSRLTSLQVGRYAEYFVKMDFTRYGFEVYTSEVDEHCIDFVVRRGAGTFYEVQVKSTRSYYYLYIPKSKLPMAPNRLLALVSLRDGAEPQLFLIPLEKWKTPDALLASRDYVGKKSKPEWGLNLSARNQKLLDKYRFELMVQQL